MIANLPPSNGNLPWSKLNIERPHNARVWNYWLGGKDNFASDREAGDRIRAVYPEVVDVARASRAFLDRAVRYLAVEAGIDQYLDIGTGLPTANNTHDVVQRIIPAARIVYVDNDPLVLVHARALLTSSPEGATAYVDADVHNPETILREAAETLDFTRPVAVMMLGILGNVTDDDEAMSIVKRLVDAVPSGSYLVVNDGTNVMNTGRESATKISVGLGTPYLPRSPELIAGFLDGLDLIPPGVVSTPRWRPDPAQPEPKELDVFCGVARKR
jgi:hypothetical protein